MSSLLHTKAPQEPLYQSKTVLYDAAQAVLKENDLGGWTRPAPGLYPHQWFWDSCFIAIGLRHIDVPRAQQELRSLIRGQWKNGLIPHIVFSDSNEYHAGPDLWKTARHPAAPSSPLTTAITQPPMLAEAVVRIADELSARKRKAWLQEMYEPLLRYHSWLYTERDPLAEGLVLLVHPWESGMDNTPPWMEMIKRSKPFKVKLADSLKKLPLEEWLEDRRKDTKQVPASERIRTNELYTVYHLLNRLKGRSYDIDRIVDSTIPLYIDLAFNAILVRANEHLVHIANELGVQLPETLVISMQKARNALATLRTEDGSYLGRDFRTHAFVRFDSIATFLPLYSGAISQAEADRLVELMQDPKTYKLAWSIPTAPPSSPYFSPRRYWQGPVWINMNWLIADGLRRYGYSKLAQELETNTVKLVQRSGIYEYYSPLDGLGAGTPTFSWTAALTIDLLQSKNS